MEDDIKAKMLRDSVIVAGHPRSGTSLVCQLLASAGIEFPSDFEGDEYNRAGYFELEQVKRLSKRLIDEAMTVKNTIQLNKIVDRLNTYQGTSGLKIVRVPAVFFYRHIAKKLRAIFVFRHPADVKASLLRRGISKFQPGWFENNNALIAAHENIGQSVLINYETLLSQPAAGKKTFGALGFEVDLDLINTEERTQQQSKIVVSEDEKRLYQRLCELEEAGK